jgi:hypothetical protein
VLRSPFRVCSCTCVWARRGTYVLKRGVWEGEGPWVDMECACAFVCSSSFSIKTLPCLIIHTSAYSRRQCQLTFQLPTKKHVCIHQHPRIHTNARSHTHARAHTHTRTHVRAPTHTRRRTRARTHTHTHTHARTHTRDRTRTHARTPPYTCACTCGSLQLLKSGNLIKSNRSFRRLVEPSEAGMRGEEGVRAHFQYAEGIRNADLVEVNLLAIHGRGDARSAMLHVLLQLLLNRRPVPACPNFS